MVFFLRGYFFLFILISISSCKATKSLKNYAQSDRVLYQKAIQNTIYPTEDKVYKNLIAINKESKDLIWKMINGKDYLLVVSWKDNISFYEPFVDSLYNTKSYHIWVTTAPELSTRMREEKALKVNRRLVELLGLPPNATHSYFVEFWVSPEDLFRPCPDQEITDSKCEICLLDKTKEIQQWMNQNRINSYYSCDLYHQYPWSQLGYTYDWNPNNEKHIGLSEFVIKKNKNVIVKAIYTTEEYLNK